MRNYSFYERIKLHITEYQFVEGLKILKNVWKVSSPHLIAKSNIVLNLITVHVSSGGDQWSLFNGEYTMFSVRKHKARKTKK